MAKNKKVNVVVANYELVYRMLACSEKHLEAWRNEIKELSGEIIIAEK